MIFRPVLWIGKMILKYSSCGVWPDYITRHDKYKHEYNENRKSKQQNISLKQFGNKLTSELSVIGDNFISSKRTHNVFFFSREEMRQQLSENLCYKCTGYFW